MEQTTTARRPRLPGLDLAAALVATGLEPFQLHLMLDLPTSRIEALIAAPWEQDQAPGSDLYRLVTKLEGELGQRFRQLDHLRRPPCLKRAEAQAAQSARDHILIGLVILRSELQTWLAAARGTGSA
jgi:hypothetical protein